MRAEAKPVGDAAPALLIRLFFIALFGVVSLLAGGPKAWHEASAQTIISNTAQLNYIMGGETVTTDSNQVTLERLTVRTDAVIKLLREFPTDSGLLVPSTGGKCKQSNGALVPISLGTGGKSGQNAGDRSLRQTASFRPGDPVFVSVEDGDQNQDSNVREEIEVRVITSAGDEEVLLLQETGTDTGVFVGGVPTVSDTSPTPNNCELLLQRGDTISVFYRDTEDGDDSVEADALVDPLGFVFDSVTGEVINGVRVTLIDLATGAPARVFGDDGISIYPSSVITGEDVTDASGLLYPGVDGAFRFPFAAQGRYRLDIVPTADYAFPSTAPSEQIAELRSPDGSPFAVLNDASYGNPFVLTGPEPLRIDIPLDPPGAGDLLLQKTVSVTDAEAGDFVQYRLELQNVDTAAATNVVIADTPPAGFRYVSGSARSDEGALPDPDLASDGSTLRFPIGTLPAGSDYSITYLLSVASNAPEGNALNRAVALLNGSVASNEAAASVRIKAPLFTGTATIIGRVSEGQCGLEHPAERPGVEGIRILMEDGRYVLTDSDGLYHFEGITPGTHVVQMDVGSLPAGYEAVACERNSRRANRAFSSFVEVQGGALWRTDFVLKRDESVVAETEDDLPAPLSDSEAAGTGRDWLTGQEPGMAILFPEVGHNPRAPSQRVVIKHMPGQKVTLTVNGNAISGYAYDGAQGGVERGFEVSRWRGLPLQNGRNVITANFAATDGVPAETLTREIYYTNAASRATLIKDKSRLTADGRTRPRIAVRITDGGGNPVRAGSSGGFTIDAPYRAAFETDQQQARQLAGIEAYAPEWRVLGDDGIAYIELDPTTQAGGARLEFTFQADEATYVQEIETWLEPGDQPFVLVGYAAGTAGFNTLKDKADRLLDRTADTSFTDGEVKLYGKGRILGKWLVTMAVNSEKPERRNGRRSLLGTIDPDEYYTIYGDGSEQRFDAATSDRLYLRIERETFYALYGDFETGLTRTELTRYSRTLTGVKTEYRGDVLGFTGFAADTGLQSRREEIQGNGLSGPYRLGARNLVLNSDKVVIEVRDRLRSDIIVSRQPQQRYIDYDIDANSGTIQFRRSIASRDAALNPIFIVVDYETEGFAEKRFNAGGRASATLGNVELGASFIRDDDERATSDLYGGDLTWKISNTTEVRGEYARSESDIQDFGKSDGAAWLVEAQHHGQKVDVTAYVREQQAGFGVGQQNNAETGTRKYGVDASVKLNDSITASASAYREDYLIGPARRDSLEAKAEWQRDRTTLRAGYRMVDDIGRDGLSRESDLLTLGGSQGVLDNRLTLDAEAEIAIGGKDESVDFPNRYRAGASYQISDAVRVIAAHEYAVGDTFEANNTQLGFDLTPWRGANLTTTLNQAGIKEFGPRTFAALGLQQRLAISKQWSLDASFDANNTLAGGIDEGGILNPAQPAASGGFLGSQGQLTEDFWAAGLGATYRNDNLSWTGRFEYRDGDGDRYGLTTSVIRQTTAGIALAGQASLFRVKEANGQLGSSANVRLSGAWRPIGSRWAVLDRLEFDLQEVSIGQLPGPFAGFGRFGADGGTSRRIVNNMAINYMTDEWSGRDDEPAEGRTQASLYWGTKYVFDRYDGEGYDGFAQAIALDVRHDISESVDIGLMGSLRHVASGPDNVSYSIGPSIGLSPITNAWLSVGYNLAGYHDEDFSDARYTRDGPYVTFRLKLDQLSPEALFGSR